MEFRAALRNVKKSINRQALFSKTEIINAIEVGNTTIVIKNQIWIQESESILKAIAGVKNLTELKSKLTEYFTTLPSRIEEKRKTEGKAERQIFIDNIFANVLDEISSTDIDILLTEQL